VTAFSEHNRCLQPATAWQKLLNHIAPAEIPPSCDLLGPEALQARLDAQADGRFSVVLVGDIMLGGPARKTIHALGADDSFAAVLPLLRHADIVVANLEGPFARRARRLPRRHSYRVHPRLAEALARSNINVVNLANNHLLDCGGAGVLETLDALAAAGVTPLGAGRNSQAAHAPVIRQAGQWRVGFLGYYWNARCAATETSPGAARDDPSTLAAEVRALRPRVDRLIVVFHWGVPYVREPAAADRDKARLAIDCGADIVVGHHPHVIQNFECYRGRPIFFSVGNFLFGSRNCRAEGLAVGVCFEENRTMLHAIPLYVKNRDPRVNYQTKVLAGPSAARLLDLVGIPPGPGETWGRLELPCPNAAGVGPKGGA
jgi:poly-gamma-glutamate capsule biosynthesis protein CapA/YwtB (metallophosphatase superfamily)